MRGYRLRGRHQIRRQSDFHGKSRLAQTSPRSVRTLVRNAAANLNIRWNKHTYVFELEESDNPVLALNLDDRAESETVLPAPRLTSTQLLALLDKAKAFPLLKKQQPEAVADAQARTFGDKPQVTDFDDYEIRIEEIFRFNTEDTLVFHVTLRNKSSPSETQVRSLDVVECFPPLHSIVQPLFWEPRK